MIWKITKIVLLFLIMEALAVFMGLSGYMIYDINSAHGDWFDTTIGGLMIFTSVIFSPVPFMFAHHDWQDWKNYRI
jgi:hypothetical protein|tara:strand:- start:373 stop:600 length:228 start_codon:yes stop_codon:yes gene_type:complete